MNVEKSSTPSVADIIAVYVAKFSATDVVTWKFQDRSWDIQVKKNQRKMYLVFCTS